MNEIPPINVERALRAYLETIIHYPDAEPIVAMQNALEDSAMFFLPDEQREAALWAIDWILENPEVITNHKLHVRIKKARMSLAEETK